MHTPGHNPFIIQGGEPYLGEISFEGGAYGGYDPIQFQLPGLYQYQGINTDIMSALTNIFSGAEGGLMELLPGNWQSWASEAGLSESGVLDAISQEYTYGPEGVELDWQFGTSPDSTGFIPTGTEDLGQGFFANIFDPESLANTLSQLGSDTLTAAEVKALTPEMLEKTTSEYYSPYEEAERASLVDKLGTATAKVNTGGFAGSGSRTAGLSGAERLYRGGYEDILGDIAKLRGGATTDVLDTIYGWQELMG